MGIFKLEVFDDHCLLTATASIYPDSGSDMNEFLSKAMATSKKVLIIDLSQVEIIYSQGITELVKTNMTAKSKKVEVCLVGVSNTVAKVFKLCGFEKLFKIYSTIEDARKGIE